jgi:acyl-CoA synthetase (AMP-forming)/AMP-acid ligase II
MSAPGRRPWNTIPAMTADSAERFADRLAVVDERRRVTYGELFESARRFGAALVASGVQPGARVAVWAFNSAEWVVSLLGLLMAGATMVPVNTRFKGPEAAHILGRSRARVLVTVTDFLGVDYVETLRSSRTALAHLQLILVARGPVPADAESWEGFLGRATEASLAELDRRRAAVTTDDPSDILFTSGTTGAPKGVVATHGRTLGVATDWVAMTSLSRDDRYLMVNPYFHMFGLKAGILACVAAGAAMLPEPTLDVERVFSRIQQEKVTVLPGPPALYQAILDHPGRGRFDLSSLRLAVTGAADIPVELIRRVHDELPFSTVISGYGLTEGGTASATDPGDEVEAIATTVGRPRPGFETRIVGEGGADRPAGQAGEIWLRGGSIMSHYLDDPEATAKALTPDGWLRTGDLGAFDEAGRLTISGRLKDMIIVGGFNVYPVEIENVLLRHPDIAAAAVIGMPDHRLGEVGMAFVVLRSGARATEARIISWSRTQMANYKVPRAVQIVDELPLNATGKVQKDVLRAQVAARRAGSPADAAEPSGRRDGRPAQSRE